MLDVIFDNIYKLIIGKSYDLKTLGYYTRSRTLMMLPVYNVQEMMDRVTFPLLSQIADDNELLAKRYRKIYQIILVLIIPTLILAIVMAEILFRFFLTEKWLPAVPYFQLICVGGIFMPLAKNNLVLLKIKGKSGPDSIAAFASARCTNEDNYIMQKFFRAVIGTNNIDHCARL